MILIIFPSLSVNSYPYLANLWNFFDIYSLGNKHENRPQVHFKCVLLTACGWQPESMITPIRNEIKSLCCQRYLDLPIIWKFLFWTTHPNHSRKLVQTGEVQITQLSENSRSCLFESNFGVQDLVIGFNPSTDFTSPKITLWLLLKSACRHITCLCANIFHVGRKIYVTNAYVAALT